MRGSRVKVRRSFEKRALLLYFYWVHRINLIILKGNFI